MCVSAGEAAGSSPATCTCEYPTTDAGEGWLIGVHPVSLGKCRERLFDSIPVMPILKKDDVPQRIVSLISLISGTPVGGDRREILNSLTKVLVLELLNVLPLCPRAGGGAENAERLLTLCSERCCEPDFSIARLARDAGLSVRTVSRFFNDSIGMPFPRTIGTLRLQRALELLRTGAQVTGAALESGFGSVRTFNRVFARELGTTPSEYLSRSAH